MNPGKYSMGIGDRFGHQGSVQLKAITEAGKQGIIITPVWNKSNREHLTIGTEPSDVRKEADEAVAAIGFPDPYFVDADHINYDTVDRFISSSDWFTVDVASSIGTKADQNSTEMFLAAAGRYYGDLKIEGIPRPFVITPKYLAEAADKYLCAAQKAGEIVSKITSAKGAGNFVVEISMDEVSQAQKPSDLFFILMMLATEQIPVQAIAPKFMGRFNKGVDYNGDPVLFAKEFEGDLLVIDRAAKEFGLPADLKLSVHSGSDKFSIYPHIGRICKKHNKGFHLKTAGTTWLEEVIGLAMAGGDAFTFVREICIEALDMQEELCSPYRDVIEINRSMLPSEKDLMRWSNTRLAGSLRHIPGNSFYNPHFRQLLHVAYKLAAQRMQEYFSHLENHREAIAECVYDNLYNRHICRIFGLD